MTCAYEQVYNTHRHHQRIANAGRYTRYHSRPRTKAGLTDLDIRRPQRLGGTLDESDHAA